MKSTKFLYTACMCPVSRRSFLKATPAAFINPISSPILPPDVDRGPAEVIFANTQLGFRPGSPKTATLVAPESLQDRLPARIPFYAMPAGYRLDRVQKTPPFWSTSAFKFYQWPYDLPGGKYTGNKDAALYTGELRRADSRWGPVWQADFSDFRRPGIFNLETEMQVALPFVIEDDPYARLMRGYLVYLYCQRSGFDVPGIRPAENIDDGRLDTGEWIPAGGGWYDAGDLRKWMSLTAVHLEGLYYAYEKGPEALRPQALDEIAWGNAWVQSMISPEGQVYEDVGGGSMRGNLTYKTGWWNENHPGCIVGNDENRDSDGIPGNADDRTVRTTYDPWVQFQFVRLQSIVSRIVQPVSAIKCQYLAEKAWQYGEKTGHDQRTLFVTGELRAAIELAANGSKKVKPEQIVTLTERLLSRQDTGSEGLSHYFMEKDETDGFRSVAYSCDPPLALVRLCEVRLPGTEAAAARARTAVELYIEKYLLADAKSNPYGLTPYGTYVRMPYPEYQKFRDAGRGRGVRTFIHPFNDQFMIHGTNAVVMQQAHLLARAGKLFNRPEWQRYAEHLLQWAMGHNPTGKSLFTGIGSQHPVPFSIRNIKIPEATVVGFIGRPDDTPYLELSNVMQWNTQEIWGVPYFHAVSAIAYLS